MCSCIYIGQAGAIRQGISKALLAIEGDHVEKLEKGIQVNV